MSTANEEALISRIVDGEASTDEWSAFEALAAADARCWRELAQAQRDHVALGRAVSVAGAIAERVSLPDSPLRVRRNLTTSLGSWSGWAVAAVVTLIATVRGIDTNGRFPLGAPQGNNPTLQAGLPTAADALKAYLDRGTEAGTVIGQMPARVLLDTRPVPAGEGYEVLYLRQIMERAIVPDLYQIEGQNELGQPTLARYTQPAQRSM